MKYILFQIIFSYMEILSFFWPTRVSSGEIYFFFQIIFSYMEHLSFFWPTLASSGEIYFLDYLLTV